MLHRGDPEDLQRGDVPQGSAQPKPVPGWRRYIIGSLSFLLLGDGEHAIVWRSSEPTTLPVVVLPRLQGPVQYGAVDGGDIGPGSAANNHAATPEGNTQEM